MLGMSADECRDRIVAIMREGHDAGLRFYTHWDEDNFMFIVRPDPHGRPGMADVIESDEITIYDFGWSR